jgi:hypothetical protein
MQIPKLSPFYGRSVLSDTRPSNITQAAQDECVVQLLNHSSVWRDETKWTILKSQGDNQLLKARPDLSGGFQDVPASSREHQHPQIARVKWNNVVSVDDLGGDQVDLKWEHPATAKEVGSR